MDTKAVAVRTGGKIVEELEIQIFSTLDELLESVSPDQIVAYYNRQKVENERNIARAKHQPNKAGKVRRLELGYQVAFEHFREELAEAIAAGKASGNPNAAKEFVLSEKVQEKVNDLLGANFEEEN